ncbi:hypothetical protein [Streptomyces sp. NPDC088794]|uniref:hypothetical protein n=1 Tax=Streptomyces sp. NPDC088794 TaxID=3365902 RepID=UPI003828724D
MTTAAPVSVEWIRLTIGGEEIELARSPGIEPRLLVDPVEYDGYLDPLTRGPDPKMRFTVDLVLTDTDEDPGWVAQRCEAEARRVAESLGAPLPTLGSRRDFSLEAGLGGEGLPYNRVSAPRLVLNPGMPHTIEEGGEVAVRVFTATALADDRGTKYQMRLVD